MPPVEGYKHTDIQNTGESSRQISNKLVDQTLSETRIDNQSVRGRIEDSGLGLSNVASGFNDEDVGEHGKSAPPLRDEVDSAIGVISDEAGPKPQVTAAQRKDLIAAVNEQTTPQPDDHFGDAASPVLDGDIDTALANTEYVEGNQNHIDGITSSHGSATGLRRANGGISLDDSTIFEDGAQIDSDKNLTIEEAFHFLSEQTKDTYVGPAALSNDLS